MEDLKNWHSIRPWRPTLSLAIREITSVSTTFILSSPFTFTGRGSASTGEQVPEDSEPSLSVSSSDDDEHSPSPDGSSANSGRSSSQVVSDVLAKGLSVKVNGLPWQRVLMKIDEEADEAVIILFGLMPGRQYGIELCILPGETFIRGKITTGENRNIIFSPNISTQFVFRIADAEPEPLNGETPIPGYVPADASSTDILAGPTSPAEPNSSVHTSPPLSAVPSNVSAVPGITLEERQRQLTHTLNLLNAEHASLSSSLKTARRESQKADAALRSEIEVLRRASDRQAAGEHRAKQKVLALQEAVKQTSAAAAEISALLADVEAALPGLEKKRAEVEQEWMAVSAEAKKVRSNRDEEERKEKRRTEALQTELTGLCNRLERLNGRNEKLEGEGGVIEELERRLKSLEEERERIESDPYGYEGDSADRSGESNKEDDWRDDGDDGRGLPHFPQLDQRGHQHVHAPGPPRRPQQQQQHSSQLSISLHSNTHHHPRTSYPPTRPIGRPEPIQRPRHSLPPSGLPAQPVQKSRYPVHAVGSQPGTGSGSGSSSSSPSVHSSTSAQVTMPPTSPLNSTLSSRAPPFEPSGRVPTSKSELNPSSAPFTLRPSVVQTLQRLQGESSQGPSRG